MKPKLFAFSLGSVFACALGFAAFVQTALASEVALARSDPPGAQVAVFAGGCFWCVESDFEKLEGVLSATSGYTGGPELSPSYEQVSRHDTGHTEAVRVVFDPKKVSFEKLVDYFFHHIDPTQTNGQFCDHGPQYRSGIFVIDDGQKIIADKVKRSIAQTLKTAVVTEVTKAGAFWIAEAGHQDFYKKSADHYQSYREGCGRDKRVKELFGSAGH